MSKKLLTPTVFILFGGMGDLSWRKLIPSLFSLYAKKQLPEKFQIMIIGRSVANEEATYAHLRDGIEQFSHCASSVQQSWQSFSTHLGFLQGDINETSLFNTLKDQLDNLNYEWQVNALHVFYMATPPGSFCQIALKLSEAGLAQHRESARLVVEKPIGEDLASAKALDLALSKHFEESQIYRIDHYLGKETVQNVLAFRFANPMFEPLWNRRYIECVTITVAEAEGVGTRAGFYEHAGALKDMIQNHLMQLFCLVAMEPPVSFEADEIRNKKVDVLHAVRTIPFDQISQFAARGQYGSGWIKGEKVEAYRDEEGVSPNSNIETFAAIKLFIDNWRWQGIPFYLRTGKRMASKYSEIAIQFRDVPHKLFPPDATFDWQPSRLVINIQPNEGIVLTLQAKKPGPEFHLKTVNMQFCYNETFKTISPEAYETLLADIFRGDQTLFMRSDQIEASWAILMPVIEAWKRVEPSDFPNYAAGTEGPKWADQLIIADGNSWPAPIQLVP